MPQSSYFRTTVTFLSFIQFICIVSSQSVQNCQQQTYFFGIPLCTECKPGYKFNFLSNCIQCNQYDRLPTCIRPQSSQEQSENKISNDYKANRKNCLFFNQPENVCIECKTGYGLNLERKCVEGLESTPIRFILEDHNTQKATKTKPNTFLEQYYGGQMLFPTQRLNLRQSPQDLTKSLINNELANSQEKVQNCKLYLGGKCMRCEQGYLLTVVSLNNFICRKISNNFYSNGFKVEVPSFLKFDEVFRQHLTRQARVNDDIHCYMVNPDPTNQIKCLKCAYRYYYSTQLSKCAQVQKQCLDFDSYSGKCYWCHFGYIVIKGKCVLMNTQNYLKGLFGK